jgi:hypothetical protein
MTASHEAKLQHIKQLPRLKTGAAELAVVIDQNWPRGLRTFIAANLEILRARRVPS